MYGAFATVIGLTTNCLRQCEYDLENPQFLQIFEEHTTIKYPSTNANT